MRLALFILCAVFSFSSPAQASKVVADLTRDRVEVRFEFSGANLTLFGAIVGDAGKVPGDRPDVVVIVRGPEVPFTVRKKERVAGIWINASSSSVKGLPGYFALFATRALSDIADRETLNKIALGDRTPVLMNTVDPSSPSVKTDEFTRAFMRLKTRKQHYRLNIDGITFIEDHLFRADFSLPADVMTGDYTARVHLFRSGKELGSYDTKFDIKKTGMEGLVFRTAQDMPFIYGILAVIGAVLAGLSASYIFRNA